MGPLPSPEAVAKVRMKSACGQALREIGLEKNLIAVSGSSSGALNAALISLNEFDKAKTIWSSIMPKQFLDINYDTIIGPLNTLVKRTLTAGLCFTRWAYRYY